MDYAAKLIYLLKAHIMGERVNADKLCFEVACEIDRREAYGLPLGNLPAIYDDALWLKCDILDA